MNGRCDGHRWLVWVCVGAIIVIYCTRAPNREARFICIMSHNSTCASAMIDDACRLALHISVHHFLMVKYFRIDITIKSVLTHGMCWTILWSLSPAIVSSVPKYDKYQQSASLPETVDNEYLSYAPWVWVWVIMVILDDCDGAGANVHTSYLTFTC